jgi:integrase
VLARGCGVVGRFVASSTLGGIMEPVVLLRAGRRRSATMMPGHRRGQAPRNKGMRYPRSADGRGDLLVMRHAGRPRPRPAVRGLIVVMWRARLRISETLALTESDLDADRSAILVRQGKGDKHCAVGLDQWGWELLRPWLAYRVQIPVGPPFCVIDGRTRGRPLTTTSVRQQLRRTAAKAGVRRRFAPPSYVTRTRSRSRVRACRSSASWGTPTSRSRRSTWREAHPCRGRGGALPR